MSCDQMGLLAGHETLRPPLQGSRFRGGTLTVAARPDRAAAAAAQAIARDYRDLYRIDRQPLTDRRLHVGLGGLDGAPARGQGLIADMCQAIDEARFEPFEISLDCVMSFRAGASRPIVLASSKPNPALRRLADRLDGLGVPIDFDPGSLVHMTVVYYDKQVMPERLAVPISWVVDRLWLVRSLAGPGSHEFLWPPEKVPDA